MEANLGVVKQMIISEIVVNAMATGIGAGFGSYFGSKMAAKSEEHLKSMFKVRKK